MDRELLIKMGWSEDLIDSFFKMQKTLGESTKCLSESVARVQSTITVDASSIDTTNMVPVAENEIRVSVQR